MSTLLYSLGRGSARHRWAVLTVWLVLLGAVGGAAAAMGGEFRDAFSIPGTESQDAADFLDERFPELSGSSATVVAAGALRDRATALTALADELRAVEGVSAVGDPFAPGAVNPAGDTLQFPVSFPQAAREVDEEVFAEVAEIVAAADIDGVQVEVGGEVASALSGEEPGGTAEVVGLLVAVLVLTITFGQLRAMVLTLFNALLAVAIAIAALLLLADVVEIPSVAEVLGLMIGLAVGIDYALFIVSRHREQLGAGLDVVESIGRALATAGGAVVFAGATVVIAMGGLLLVGIPFISLMAMSVVLAVVLAVAAAVTLLPALLGIAGGSIARITLPGLRGRPVRAPREQLGARWSRWVTRRPWLSFLGGLAVVALLAVPLLDLETAMPTDGTAPEDSSRRQAHDLVAEGFGAGANAPLLVVVDHAGLDPAATQAALAEVTAAVGGAEDVVAVAPPRQNAAGDATVLTAIPSAGPADAATVALLERLRGEVLAEVEEDTGVTTYVAGPTAVNIDIDDKLLSRLPWLMAAVIGLTFLLLMVAFRSLLVPLKAAIGILLSIGAALGIVVAVFQWGWGAELIGVDTTTPIISFLPVIAFAILFGLSMDYEVFILSRIREEWLRTGDAHDSVVTGVGVTARVITAAAAIMISVFGGFIAGDDPTIKMIGLGLASAVLIDATLVRLVLVPSTMVMFDRANWWLPRWLDRLLPHVDIEGERLLEELEAADRGAGSAQELPPAVLSGLGLSATGEPVVKTAELRLEVGAGGTDRAVTRLVAAAASVGGHVTELETLRVDQARSIGRVTLRVPVRHLEQVLVVAQDIGTLTAARLTSEDIDGGHLDLAARHAVLGAHRQALLGALGSVAPERIAAVREELDEVQHELDVSAGRLDQLGRATTTGSLSVRVEERAGTPDAVALLDGSLRR